MEKFKKAFIDVEFIRFGASFESLGDYKDSLELAATCKKLAEDYRARQEEKNDSYIRANKEKNEHFKVKMKELKEKRSKLAAFVCIPRNILFDR